MTLYAVDPGDVHVGIAHQRAGRQAAAFEELADQTPYFFHDVLRPADTLVIEEFRLYPNKAAAQSWSPMRTSELIGALKWIAAQHDAQVVMQPASIKIPTRKQCAARGICYNGVDSIHAKDAWLHLQYFILRGGKHGNS